MSGVEGMGGGGERCGAWEVEAVGEGRAGEGRAGEREGCWGSTGVSAAVAACWEGVGTGR